MTLVLGLTGSIGMGKTTTAGFFKQRGIPVWDADASVHRLYAKGGPAVPGIATICPGAVKDGVIDRAVLRHWISSEPGAMAKIESIVHPLVAADRHAFIKRAQAQGQQIVVVDIPLLFETNGERMVDAVLVVSAPKEVQIARVLERADMTRAHLAQIMARQMPDAEKRKRADYVIETTSIKTARAAVDKLLAELETRKTSHA